MADNELALKQRNSLGLYTQIKLIDGRELQVITKKKKVEQIYSVDILSLRDKSKASVCIAWKWLVAAAFIFTATLLLLKMLPPYLGENKNIYLGIILFSGLLASIFSIVLFWKNSAIQQIFYSKKAHVPIIKLNIAKPSKEIFTTFIHSIEKRIKEFQSHMQLDDDKQLVGEMKMLRRLSDNGIISKKSYELAKKKLFTGFDSQVINRE